MKKLHIISILLILVLCISGCASAKKIDLAAGTTFAVEGLNGKGTITVDMSGVDDQGLKETMDDATEKALTLAFQGKDYSKYEKVYDRLSAFSDSLNCTWDKENGTYSNGDEAVYSCTFDEDAAKKAGFTYTNVEMKYTVEGLQEVEEIDLFEGIDYEWDFENYSSYGGVKLKLVANSPTAWVRDNVQYSTGNLDASGNFTVTANYNESSLEEAGYVVKNGENSKTYNIGVQPTKITEVITDDTREAATAAAENYLNTLMDQCGNVFTYKGNPINMTGYKFDEFSGAGLLSTFGANYYLTDENENTYKVNFPLTLFRMGDGTIKDMTSMTGACKVDYQNDVWPTYWH